MLIEQMKKRLWKRTFLVVSLIGIAAIACLAILWRGNDTKPELSISRIVDVHDEDATRTLDFRFPIDDPDDDVVVVMRVRNPHHRIAMFGRERVQSRVEGRWLEEVDVSWLNSAIAHFVRPRSEEEFVIAVVPRRTESLRLFVEYRYESLYENWHRGIRYRVSNARFTRSAKFIGRLYVGFDNWVINPLREYALAVEWQRITAEFRLPDLTDTSELRTFVH